MLSQTLINKFNSSPHALFNDGTVEQLRECLKVLFPKDISTASGDYNYYSADMDNEGEWSADDETDLPIIRVTEFFEVEPTEKTVKVSEVMAEIDRLLDSTPDKTSITVSIPKHAYKPAKFGYDIALNNIKQYLNNL